MNIFKILLLLTLPILFTSCDKDEGSSTKTVEIQRIEYAPVFENSSYDIRLVQGGSNSFTFPNCVDVDEENTVSYSLVSSFSQCSLSNCLSNNQDLICDIDCSGVPAFLGTDTMTYRCNNGKENSSNNKTVNLTVYQPSNSAPVFGGSDIDERVVKGGTSSITVPACIDALGNTVNYSITTNLTQCSISNCLSNNTDRTCDIDCSGVPSYTGSETLTYKCNNGTSDSSNNQNINIEVYEPWNTGDNAYTFNVSRLGLTGLYESREVEKSGSYLFMVLKSNNGLFELYRYDGTTLVKITHTTFSKYNFTPYNLKGEESGRWLIFNGIDSDNKEALWAIDNNDGSILKIPNGANEIDNSRKMMAEVSNGMLRYYSYTDEASANRKVAVAYFYDLETQSPYGKVYHSFSSMASAYNTVFDNNYIAISDNHSYYSNLPSRGYLTTGTYPFSFGKWEYIRSINKAIIWRNMNMSTTSNIIYSYDGTSLVMLTSPYAGVGSWCNDNFYFRSSNQYSLYKMTDPSLSNNLITSVDSFLNNYSFEYSYTSACVNDRYLISTCEEQSTNKYGMCVFDTNTSTLSFQVFNYDYRSSLNKTNQGQLFFKFFDADSARSYDIIQVDTSSGSPVIDSTSRSFYASGIQTIKAWHDTTNDRIIHLMTGINSSFDENFMSLNVNDSSQGNASYYQSYEGLIDAEFYNGKYYISGFHFPLLPYHPIYRINSNEAYIIQRNHLWILNTAGNLGDMYQQFTP